VHNSLVISENPVSKEHGAMIRAFCIYLVLLEEAQGSLFSIAQGIV
jgi:hypothetical protein